MEQPQSKRKKKGTVAAAEPPVPANMVVQHIPLENLRPNPWDPRQARPDDVVRAMADSIAQVGLLQYLMARPVEDGFYELSFGMTRRLALMVLRAEGKWGDTAPVQVRMLTDEEMAIVAITENRQRKDITPIEELRGFKKALDEIKTLTIQKLADTLGIDRSTLSNGLRVLRLPDFVLEHVDSGAMSVHAAREFLCLVGADHQHDEDMAWVVKSIAQTHGRDGRPDWRTDYVRELIRHRVWQNEEVWRPLGPRAEDGIGAIYDTNRGGSGREPTFEVEAFKKEFPNTVHSIPGGKATTRLWTCDKRSWQRWQTAATREANKEAEAEGQPKSSDKPKAERDTDLASVLATDPVMTALRRTVPWETEVQGAIKRMKDVEPPPKPDVEVKGEDVEVPSAVSAWAYHTFNAVMCKSLKADPSAGNRAKWQEDPMSMLDEQTRAQVEGALGEDDVVEAVDNFFRTLDESLAKKAAKRVKDSQLTAEDKEALGSRATLVTGYAQGSFRQLLRAKGEGYYSARDIPDWFDNKECLETCTQGASYCQEYRGGSVYLACTNKECYEERYNGCKRVFMAKAENESFKRDGKDLELAERFEGNLSALPLSTLRALFLCAVMPYAKEGIRKAKYWEGANYSEKHEEFWYEPEVLLEARTVLGIAKPASAHKSLDVEAAVKQFMEIGDGKAPRALAMAMVGLLEVYTPANIQALLDMKAMENPAHQGI
jgi:ParB/RepB/Spo0J family partition protein